MLIKANGPINRLFILWGALIVSGWDAMGLARKSYLGQTETACFCLFRDVRVYLRVPCVTQKVERISLDLSQTFLFFSFMERGARSTLFFWTIYPFIFLMLLNKTSGFTSYVFISKGNVFRCLKLQFLLLRFNKIWKYGSTALLLLNIIQFSQSNCKECALGRIKQRSLN